MTKIGELATTLAEQPEKQVQLSDEINAELRSFIVWRGIAANNLPTGEVRHRLDTARKHCRALIACLDAKEFDLGNRAARKTIGRIYVEIEPLGFRENIHEINSLSRGGLQENAEWLNTLCKQLYELDISIGAAYEALKGAVGRPKDMALRKLVRGLAEIYERETRRNVGVSWDDSKGTYSGPFLEFVAKTLEIAGEPVNKVALGSAIRRALSGASK